MKTINSSRFTFTEGTSDKEYNIMLLGDGTNYVVNFSYGKRNSTLKADTKTAAPVSLAEATKLYDKMVKERYAKGYSLDGAGVVSTVSGTAGPKTKDATLVQLLKEIKDEVELLKFLNDDNYVMQQKQDGERRTVNKTESGVSGGNKKGETTNLPQSVIDCLDKDKDIELDAEIIGEVLYVFDILRLNKKDLKSNTYKERLKALNKKSFGSNVEIVHTAFAKEEKVAFLQKLRDENAEGAVFKHIEGQYKAGRDSSTAYKFKFYKTATVKVSAITKGKRSVQMSVKDGTDFINVGAVTIPPNKDIPEVGEFIEVRYLYAYKGGSLFQPTFLFKRDDSDETDAVIEQLQYKKD